MFMAEPKSNPTGSATSTRRPRMPGQGQLIWASIMVALGSFLPWVSTGFGNISGMTGLGAGYWTFIAGTLGIAGGLMPYRRVAIVHGVITAIVAIALPVWQVLHLFSLVGFDGWMPGVGLVLVLFGGLFAAGAARTLANLEVVPAPSAA